MGVFSYSWALFLRMRLSYLADSLTFDPFEAFFFFLKLRDNQSSLWGWFSVLLRQEPLTTLDASWIMWFLTLGGGIKIVLLLCSYRYCSFCSFLRFSILVISSSILGWFHTHVLIIFYSAEDLKRAMYESAFFHCSALSSLVPVLEACLAALAPSSSLQPRETLGLVLVLSPCAVAWTLFPDKSKLGWLTLFVTPSRDLWNPLDSICGSYCFVQFLFH